MKSRLRQNIESLVLAVLVALLVRSSVVEAFWVPSGSMLPTIQIGDHLFVNKLAYGMHLPFVGKEITQWRPLHRGDIVVFRSPVDQRTDLGIDDRAGRTETTQHEIAENVPRQPGSLP